MLKIKKDEQGYMIGDNIYLSLSDTKKGKVNLLMTKGQEMNFGPADFKIDYPGEYDKDWLNIKVYEWDETKLNYVVRLNGKVLWIIQNRNILEKEDIQDIDYWVFTDPSTTKTLDRLEYEWERYLLSEDGVQQLNEVVEDATSEEETE